LTVAQAQTDYPSIWVQNNLQVDPGFIDAAKGDFHLQGASPVKAAGKSIDSVMGTGFVDYYGNAWDPVNPSIGAIQYTSILSPTAIPTLIAAP
jgi:hypothetical protein